MERKSIPLGPRLVVMVGPSGAGKSTWLEENAGGSMVVSSDAIREELTGDFRRQDKNHIVFDEFHRRIAVGLQTGQRVFADATHLSRKSRRETVRVADDLGVPVCYLVINRSLEEKVETAGWRNNIKIGDMTLVERHDASFHSELDHILSGDNRNDIEVFNAAHVNGGYKVDAVPNYATVPACQVGRIIKSRGFNKLRIIGDVHANRAELEPILKDTPDDHMIMFLGDIVDYGHDFVWTVSVVYDLFMNGRAIGVRGNHDDKISRYILAERKDGFRGKISHGNQTTTEVLESCRPKVRKALEDKFLAIFEKMRHTYVIGNNIFAHGAVFASMFDDDVFTYPKNSSRAAHIIYGETNGEFHEDTGYPVRTYNWVNEIPEGKCTYTGHDIRSTDEPLVVVGEKGGVCHFVDTGSSKHGKLSYMDIDL